MASEVTITETPYSGPVSFAVNTTEYLFTPPQYPACALWLDASDATTVVTSNGAVNQWKDKSGNGSNATATGTIRYSNLINGLNAMYYSGAFSTYFRGSIKNTSSNLTAFSVAIMNSSSYPSARILSLGIVGSVEFNNTLYTAAIERGTGNTLNSYRNFAPLGQASYTFGTPAIACTLYTGTSNTFYINGTAGTTVASSGNFGYSNYEIGGDFGEESLVNYNGSIGEIIIYHATLSTNQCQQVEGYLAWKWGLQGSLPASHPFYYNRITPIPVSIPTLQFTQSPYWLPTQFPGVTLWLDAADATTVTQSNAAVTSVRDKSGNGYNLSNGLGFTYPNNIFNGTYPSFYCAPNIIQNSNYILGINSSFNFPQPAYIFMVGVNNSISPNTRSYAYDSTTSSNRCFFFVNASITTFSIAASTGNFSYNDGSSYTNNTIYNNIINSTSSGMYLNGTSVGTGTMTNSGTTGITVGGQYSIKNSWIGHICELIIYSNALTTGQRQQVEGYLAWKWGLRTSLPSSHPNYYIPAS